jgi:phage FluMu protein Com
MFSCTLCRDQCEEYVLIQSHCTTCEQIRRIISLYDKTKVLETLRTVYLRDDKPIVNRTNKIVNDKEKDNTDTRKSNRLNKGLKMIINEPVDV